MNRINIWMDEELHKSLKIAAALKGVTVQQFVTDSIQNAVKRDNRLLVRLIK